jgi:hypothetical protein
MTAVLVGSEAAVPRRARAKFPRRGPGGSRVVISDLRSALRACHDESPADVLPGSE